VSRCIRSSSVQQADTLAAQRQLLLHIPLAILVLLIQVGSISSI
jgi:hypothetical protein